jgi:hypothetical protein
MLKGGEIPAIIGFERLVWLDQDNAARAEIGTVSYCSCNGTMNNGAHVSKACGRGWMNCENVSSVPMKRLSGQERLRSRGRWVFKAYGVLYNSRLPGKPDVPARRLAPHVTSASRLSIPMFEYRLV